MITELAPLGATHRVVVTLDYGEQVTATVILHPKDEKKDKQFSFQLAGPAEELNASFAEKLTEAATKITTAKTGLDELDAQLAAAKAEKEAELKKAKTPDKHPGYPKTKAPKPVAKKIEEKKPAYVKAKEALAKNKESKESETPADPGVIEMASEPVPAAPKPALELFDI